MEMLDENPRSSQARSVLYFLSICASVGWIAPGPFVAPKKGVNFYGWSGFRVLEPYAFHAVLTWLFSLPNEVDCKRETIQNFFITKAYVKPLNQKWNDGFSGIVPFVPKEQAGKSKQSSPDEIDRSQQVGVEEKHDVAVAFPYCMKGGLESFLSEGVGIPIAPANGIESMMSRVIGDINVDAFFAEVDEDFNNSDAAYTCVHKQGCKRPRKSLEVLLV